MTIEILQILIVFKRVRLYQLTQIVAELPTTLKNYDKYLSMVFTIYNKLSKDMNNVTNIPANVNFKLIK